MSDFTVRTATQLPLLLQGFRKKSGMTQAALAKRLGVTQQTLSALERNAEKVSADRLLHILSLLHVELVLREAETPTKPRSSSDPGW